MNGLVIVQYAVKRYRQLGVCSEIDFNYELSEGLLYIANNSL